MCARPKSSAAAVSRAVAAAIRVLQGMRQPDALLSGPGSGLICTWDEICGKQQTEEFFGWPAYEMTIRGIIAGYVDDLSRRERVALWLGTDKGEDWAFDHAGEIPDPVSDDCVEFVFQALLNRANDYTNARIRRYVDRSYID